MLFSHYQPVVLSPQNEAHRAEVRAFLQEALEDYPATKRMASWMGFDLEFTRRLAEKGWIGCTLPPEYGGLGKDQFYRYVLVEELLAAGAPVLAHWTADRQSAPLILRYGSEEQKQRFLPPICRGEEFFCIGMSEPDAGSDLAAVNTRARPVEGGWVINGTKLWTTNAHRCQWMIALVRTSVHERKHEGLSQVIIDLQAPGVGIQPIVDLAGESHFNEVVFQDVFVPDNQLIGSEGSGWKQVLAELALERSGPERYLSTAALMTELVRVVQTHGEATAYAAVGELMAEMMVLRQMSLSIADQLQKGQTPNTEAACVKDLGTLLEQRMPELAHQVLDILPQTAGDDVYAQVLAYITQVAPSFSLRGGTREILRGIVARGLENH